MVPFEVLDVAKVQIAKTKAPVPVVIRKANQPIHNQLILSIILSFIAIARLANSKGFVRQTNGGCFISDCHAGPSHVCETASPLFYEGCGHDLRFKLLFDVYLLEGGVLSLKLLHASHHGGAHAAEFDTPLIESRSADI